MNANKIIYPELSYKVMGVLFDVHSQLGNRLQEKYYQRAVTRGLKEFEIPFQEQVLVRLEYKGEPIGRYFVDFVVDRKIALDIKALPKRRKEDYDQMLAYLNVLNLKLGIVANFRTSRLTYKRLVNPKFGL